MTTWNMDKTASDDLVDTHNLNFVRRNNGVSYVVLVPLMGWSD